MKKNKKKTIKVKRKKVKRKKTIKKTTKKKVRRRKKRVVKKSKIRRRKKKVSMEDIYSILNQVQIGKKKITFATYLIDAATIEHTIQDVGLKYKKSEMKKQAVFTLYPDKTGYEEEEPLSLEIMDDEIPDIGQIFG